VSASIASTLKLSNPPDVKWLTSMLLSVPVFADQFDPQRTQLETIKKVWSRLLRDQSNIVNSMHPKGFAMATLYMLHIESFLSHEKPKDDDQLEGRVSVDRRELLKRFGNWVPCECNRTCGCEWNFANDIGMHRGGKERKCALIKVLGEPSLKDLLITKKELQRMKDIKNKWDSSRSSH
jgi:calcium-independent phospholipase A2-gamma